MLRGRREPWAQDDLWGAKVKLEQFFSHQELLMWWDMTVPLSHMVLNQEGPPSFLPLSLLRSISAACSFTSNAVQQKCNIFQALFWDCMWVLHVVLAKNFPSALWVMSSPFCPFRPLLALHNGSMCTLAEQTFISVRPAVLYSWYGCVSVSQSVARCEHTECVWIFPVSEDACEGRGDERSEGKTWGSSFNLTPFFFFFFTVYCFVFCFSF